MELRGAYTALVTPIINGEFDEKAYRNLVEWQIEKGIDGLVPCGTTGEAATLSHKEQGRVIRVCVEQAAGRVPVIAGSGSNSTREAIQLTQMAKDAGADASLQVTPYYNKPSTAGLIGHYKAIAAEVSIPFVVYNVPGRTGLNLQPTQLKAIVDEVPQVIAVKEATGSMIQATDIVELLGTDFNLLSGDDFTALSLLAVGGRGVISVISNIMPAQMSNMCKAFHASDIAKAQELHLLMNPINRAMFIETNPIPVKTSLALMGIIPPAEFRLPICPLALENLEKLKGVLQTANLI